MTIPDNSALGTPWLWGIVDAGPSIGRVRRPLFNDKVVTDATYTVQPWDNILLLNRAGVQQIFLPAVSVWMANKWGGIPLFIMDKGGNAGTYTKTLTPSGADVISGQASWAIVGDYASVVLRPLSDLSGWAL